jgi:hypothetical protein
MKRGSKGIKFWLTTVLILLIILTIAFFAYNYFSNKSSVTGNTVMTEMVTQSYCYDSDSPSDKYGGKNYYEQGTTSKGSDSKKDFCLIGTNKLFENYCDYIDDGGWNDDTTFGQIRSI